MAVKVTVTKETAAVFLDATEGEHLTYKVTVRGATPVFTLVDSELGKLLMSSKDEPTTTTPAVSYQRKWPLPADSTVQVTNHTLGMHFLAAIEYRYQVERERSDGTIDVLIDITYKSTSPEDWFFQALDVTTV